MLHYFLPLLFIWHDGKRIIESINCIRMAIHVQINIFAEV